MKAKSEIIAKNSEKISPNHQQQKHQTTTYMKKNIYLTTVRFLPILAVMANCHAATQIVNIDFNGTRNGDPAVPTTFVGAGAVTNGGGTFFNGLLANSQGPTNNDALTVGGSNLLDEFNTLTTVGFTIGPVGGDTGTGDDLTEDYIFVNSGGATTDATFTISGLGAGTADLYFQIGFISPGGGAGAGVFITGSTGTPGFSGNGHSWLFFNDVPITAGSITGTLGNPAFNPAPDAGDVVVLNGMTIVTVPEPASAGLLAMGALGLLARRRR